MRAITALAWKEIKGEIRNRWIVGAISLLFLLALSLYLLGSAPAGDVKASTMSVTVVSLAGLSVYLLPLIALMLSFDAFVGEVEDGTMLLLLSYPVRRMEVIAGKFVGHLLTMALAILIGYGGTGLIIAFTAPSGSEDWQAFLLLMASSLLLGTVYLSLGYLISVAVRQRGTAVAAAIAVWLVLVVVYDLALLGMAVNGADLGISESLFAMLLLVNPTDAYRILNLTGVDAVRQVAGTLGMSGEHGFSMPLLLTAMAAWIFIALGCATALFSRREL